MTPLAFYLYLIGRDSPAILRGVNDAEDRHVEEWLDKNPGRSLDSQLSWILTNVLDACEKHERVEKAGYSK